MNGLLERMQVVMLPTKSIVTMTPMLSVGYQTKRLYFKRLADDIYPEAVNPHHLYICSNREIKEGNWCIAHGTSTNGQYRLIQAKIIDNNIYDGNRYWGKFECKKIEATIDTELWTRTSLGGGHFENKPLPRPSNEFIQRFVREQGKIKEVMVEMDKERCSGTFVFDRYDENSYVPDTEDKEGYYESAIYKCNTCKNEAYNLAPYSNKSCHHHTNVIVKTKPDKTIIIHPVDETWEDIYGHFRNDYDKSTGKSTLPAAVELIEYLRKNNYSIPKKLNNE